jgi:hypothetical protein
MGTGGDRHLSYRLASKTTRVSVEPNGSPEPKIGLLAVTEEKTGWRNQFKK